MKICLIRCPSPYLIEERAFPPLGLVAVGTSLKIRGHAVTIYDGPLEELPLTYSHYGFGPTAPEYPYSRKAKAYIREHNPSAKMVLGGTHPTLNPLACLEDDWDCIVVGDGEVISEEAFAHGKGLLYGDDRPLDEYPIPDRSLLDMTRYGDMLDGRRATSLITSRGCPFQCAFCCKNHSRVRVRSAPKVIEEIAYLHEDIGFSALAFPEDIFIIDRQRAETVFTVLKDRDIRWRCQVRADLCVKYGPEFLRTMAESGCSIVGMGIESGSPQILKTIQKGETIQTIQRGIDMLHAAGIKVKGYFVVGLPGETLATLDETERFLETAGLDDADIKILQPFPGSPIWDRRKKYDISWNGTALENTFYKGHRGEYCGSLCTSALTTAQIVEAWKHLAGRFESRNRTVVA